MIYSKSDFVSQLASGELSWEVAKGQDVRVRVYGDTAVATGRFLEKGRLRGKEFNTDERFTSVWEKRDRAWRAVSEQVAQIPRRLDRMRCLAITEADRLCRNPFAETTSRSLTTKTLQRPAIACKRQWFPYATLVHPGS